MSMKAGNTPLPWSWEIDEDDQLMLYDAEGNVVGQLFDHGSEAEAKALCDALNNEWVHKHNAEEAAEYIAFLKGEREKLLDLIRRMALSGRFTEVDALRKEVFAVLDEVRK